ncbi:MAG: diguanylate cyclase [Sulfuricaulis sp.]|uniref:diguanylate cyclase domain-containing protein n=1 Tax=Sulfuricaulis sp. TaxID=2003553 RepID=UPI0034A3D15A
MTKSSFPASGSVSVDGIEVVELSDIDLDFAVEEAFRQGASQAPATTRTEAANPQDLGTLELFQGVGDQDLAVCAARCQLIHALPGHVLFAPGRLNTKIFFVLEGQLRLYAQTGDKRPMAVADVGHSTGLRSALAMQPLDHSAIATEVSRLLVVDIAAIDELAKRSHAFARNYAALLASYLRGDDCLHVGARTGAAARPGYIDELTLLRNQRWLDEMFPRLLGRYRLGDKTLAVAAFAVDKLDEIVKQHGIGPSLRVLEAIGHWMQDQTRPTNILAIDKNRRIFAFLPDCDLDAARHLAGRIKTQVQSLPISLATETAPQPITVTLSLGIAVLERGKNEHDFLGKTEALIQKSIKLGGNWLSEAL